MGEDWALPGYVEVGQLGSGGFGRVVLAKHTGTGELVAVKYLRAEFLTQQEIVDGFRREAWLLSGVRSPHVAQVRDFVQSTSGAALVMEAVPGVSLQALLKVERALHPESALAVLKGSLLGLSAAHTVGVVHRDYKPANVLVSQRRESKLVDFGLATLDGHAGLAAGSPAYMAPEQWAGQPGTPATDVYAATCVFFECVTGRKPFDAPPQQVKAMHEQAPVPLDALPEPLRDLVARGMAKDVARRPASAGAFVDQLERAARAGYGRGWEARGWKRLAEAVGALVAVSPLALLATTSSGALKAAAWASAPAKIAGAVVATGAVVAAGVVVFQGLGEDARAADPRPAPPTYAYATDAGTTVMNGTDVVATDRTEYFYGTTFTVDGRFAFGVLSDGGIRAIDTTTGKPTSVRCDDCYSVVPVGASEVAWRTEDGRVMRVDLAGDRTPREWRVRLPEVGPTGDGQSLLAGGNGVVLTADHAVTGGEPVNPHLAAPDRSPRAVDTGSEAPVLDAEFSLDGKRVAILNASVKTQACPDSARISVVDVATGEVTSSVIDAPPDAGGHGYVHDLWWSAQGRLHASFMLCEQVGADSSDVDYVVEPSVWRLDGTRWVEVDPGPVSAVRQLDEDTRLVLEADGRPGRFESGTLYLEDGGKRTKIADGVRDLQAARPASMPVREETTTSSSSAEPEPSIGSYTNERYGYTSYVPEGFQETMAAANNDGMHFLNPDLDAELDVWGANNTDGATAEQSVADVVAATERDGGQVTYSDFDADSYTVSGYLDDGQIFYVHVFVGTGSHAGLRFVYPKENRAALDEAVTRTVAEFQPGDLSQPH